MTTEPFTPVEEVVPVLIGADGTFDGSYQPLGVLQALLQRKHLGPVAFFERPNVETIIAFDPFEVIRARGQHAEVNHRGERFTVEKNPVAAIAERMALHPVPRKGGFRGGALGYVGYDAVRLLEPTLTHTPGNLQRLAKHPGLDAEVALFRNAIIFDHQQRHILLVSGSFPGEPPADFTELRQLLDAPSFSLKGPAKTPLEMDQMNRMLGRERFLRGVEQLKEHIFAGDIFQAVLSDELSYPFEGDALQLFGHLCALSPSPYRFIFFGTERTVMGASPEMLLRVHGDELETHPIAGTYRGGDDAVEEATLEARLLADEKERAEHLMLVDLARNDIGRVAKAGTVAVHDFMHVRRFGAVMHLISRVTGKRLPNVSALQAMASCFPAGTLSGAPKIKAMQLLSELEPNPRGFYGGAVLAAGFDGDLESCIAIRCVELKGGQAIIRVGAGVVADSEPLKEHDEITHKSRIARTALASVLAP